MSRTVTIRLGIACALLLVGLVGAILVYSSMIDNKNNKISDLSQQVTSLSSQVTDLTSIANLTESTIWVNFKNVIISAGYETGWNVIANYAGYVSVQIFSSTKENIYVRVTYSSHGVDHEDQIIVGMGEQQFFRSSPL